MLRRVGKGKRQSGSLNAQLFTLREGRELWRRQHMRTLAWWKWRTASLTGVPTQNHAHHCPHSCSKTVILQVYLDQLSWRIGFRIGRHILPGTGNFHWSKPQCSRRRPILDGGLAHRGASPWSYCECGNGKTGCRWQKKVHLCFTEDRQKPSTLCPLEFLLPARVGRIGPPQGIENQAPYCFQPVGLSPLAARGTGHLLWGCPGTWMALVPVLTSNLSWRACKISPEENEQVKAKHSLHLSWPQVSKSKLHLEGWHGGSKTKQNKKTVLSCATSRSAELFCTHTVQDSHHQPQVLLGIWGVASVHEELSFYLMWVNLNSHK